jgi:hypothetical protein
MITARARNRSKGRRGGIGSPMQTAASKWRDRLTAEERKEQAQELLAQ